MKSFLTIAVTCNCGHTSVKGFLLPTSLGEIKSTLEICRAVVKCEFSGTRFVESMGGPAVYFPFIRELRKQEQAATVSQRVMAN